MLKVQWSVLIPSIFCILFEIFTVSGSLQTAFVAYLSDEMWNLYGFLYSLVLTHFSWETLKKVIVKQCKSRSDAAECSIWLGFTLFALKKLEFL